MRMDRETYEALLESIEKWKKIASDPEAPNRGRDDCALCQLYNPGPMPIDEDRELCEGCPVYEVTGVTGCRRTPCEDHNYLTLDEAPQAEKDHAASREVSFLESLLPYISTAGELL